MVLYAIFSNRIPNRKHIFQHLTLYFKLFFIILMKIFKFMNKGFLPATLFAAFVTITGIQGCKKVNNIGVDNDNAVATPYSLYVGDKHGSIFNSNNGEDFATMFRPDGFAPYSITTAGPNLVVVKQNLHMSTDNGKIFNAVYYNVKHYPWQNMAYYSLQHKTTYVASSAGRTIASSKDNGQTWEEETNNWEPNVAPNFEVSSFSGLANGKLFAYSNTGRVMFRKDNAGANWAPVVMESNFFVDGAEYYISSNNTTLFMTDYNGIGGVWYSENEGLNWTRIGQGALPHNHKWLSAASPNGGRTFLVGTDGHGVYRVDGDQMVSANIGLVENIKVNGMTVKRNVYKNGSVRNFVFIATNFGIYRSEDHGRSWVLMSKGALDNTDFRVAN